MFSHSFYLLLHILGIALMFAAIGGVAIHAANGGTKSSSSTRKLVSIGHGVGALIVLVGGFGMLARLGMQHGAGFPAWLWVKIGIWLVLSAVVLLPYRKPALARPFFILMPLLAGFAAYMAVYKPIN